MNDWYATLDDAFWLKADDVGEDEARFIKDVLHLRRGHSVLDTPCGAGRIACHLAKSGCIVTGIDLRRSFINRARKRFKQAGFPGTFHIKDMRQINYTDEFHGIFNWFGSFGYFSDSENDRLVECYAKALKRGGRLLLEQSNRENILRHFIPERRDEHFIIRNRWDLKSERLLSSRIINGHNDPRNRSSIRLYTPTQLTDLLSRNGMIVENIYGSIEGIPYNRSSRRMIVIAKKG